MKLRVLLGAVLLVVAACGGSEETTTTAPAVQQTTTSDATTTAPPATTTTAPPATTTTPAPTTTTAAPTTTTTQPEPDGDAAELAMSKAMAAIDALPDGWSSELIDQTDTVEFEPGEDDPIFGRCTPDDAFDVELLDEATAAAFSADFSDPTITGLFPGPDGNVEVRVFESEDVAAEAFEVLETVYGTDEGRDCVADVFIEELAGQLPAGDTLDFSISELDFDRAEIASRIEFTLESQGISAMIFLDFAATRQGPTTIFASFMSFSESFPEDVAESTFGAALDA